VRIAVVAPACILTTWLPVNLKAPVVLSEELFTVVEAQLLRAVSALQNELNQFDVQYAPWATGRGALGPRNRESKRFAGCHPANIPMRICPANEGGFPKVFTFVALFGQSVAGAGGDLDEADFVCRYCGLRRLRLTRIFGTKIANSG
jgi:hypothetical protein